jgi:hypothetical protein
MRILLHVKFPHEPFNAALRDGTLGQKIKKILDESKPEAVYFTNYHGRRGVILIVDLKDPSQVPALAEPWFLAFNADVDFHVAMTPEDLGRAGLEELGRKWG